METAIQVVWWIGLIGALIPTVVILKQVAILLRELRGILELAEIIRGAARGIRQHMEPVAGLAPAVEPGGRIRDAAAEISTQAAALEQRLSGLLPARR